MWKMKYSQHLIRGTILRLGPNLEDKIPVHSDRGFASSDDSSPEAADEPKSYYDVLEVNKNATQEEIKTAYYSLSKHYHPDKNPNSEDAALKFQAITDAYEILGNYHLRKKYDKGILPSFFDEKSKTHGGFTDHHIEHDKFFQSRLHRSSTTTTTTTAQPSKYDVEGWTKTHYSQTITRQAMSKKKRADRKEYEAGRKQFDNKLDTFLLLLIIAAALQGVFGALLSDDKKRDKAPSEK